MQEWRAQCWGYSTRMALASSHRKSGEMDARGAGCGTGGVRAVTSGSETGSIGVSWCAAMGGYAGTRGLVGRRRGLGTGTGAELKDMPFASWWFHAADDFHVGDEFHAGDEMAGSCGAVYDL